MNGTDWVVAAYVVGLGLLWGYAIVLGLACRWAHRRAGEAKAPL